MVQEDRKAIHRRLARIEGQVKGIRRLLEADAYCCDILQQISAVSSALSQVSASVATQHIKHCVIRHGTSEAHPATVSMTREEVEMELEDVLRRLVR